MTAPSPKDVDELRQRLKALGYLDAGVDRFVLAPARTGRTRAALAMVASIRIGGLAGLLVGLSGTIAMALRLPSMVATVRDGLAVAVVVAIAFGLVTAVATFASIVLASHAVRWFGPRVSLHARMRPVALGAGVVVGSACLVYLTLWWNVTNASAGMSATTLVALLVAVVISVMLGHVTTTTALALMAFELDDRLPTTPRIASWRSTAALALVGIAAASLVVVVTTRTGDRARDAALPALTVVPTGVRVVVIGIDGFDPAFARTLVHDGELPALAQVLASPHLDIPRGEGADPVPLWASIATGQPPARHGAIGLDARRVAGLDGQLPLTGSRLVASHLGGDRPAQADASQHQFWTRAAGAGLLGGGLAGRPARGGGELVDDLAGAPRRRHRHQRPRHRAARTWRGQRRRDRPCRGLRRAPAVVDGDPAAAADARAAVHGLGASGIGERCRPRRDRARRDAVVVRARPPGRATRPAHALPARPRHRPGAPVRRARPHVAGRPCRGGRRRHGRLRVARRDRVALHGRRRLRRHHRASRTRGSPAGRVAEHPVGAATAGRGPGALGRGPIARGCRADRARAARRAHRRRHRRAAADRPRRARSSPPRIPFAAWRRGGRGSPTPVAPRIHRSTTTHANACGRWATCDDANSLPGRHARGARSGDCVQRKRCSCWGSCPRAS